MNKRILYLIPHLAKTSSAIQLLNLIKYLDRELYTPIIASCYQEISNSIQHLFEMQDVLVINLNLERWQLRKQRKKITEIIIKEKIDIVHSCSVLTDGVCGSLNYKVPLVITLHNYMYEDVITRYGRVLGGYMCIRELRAINKAVAAIVVSNTLKNKYENRLNKRFVAIPNGIEIEEWKNVDNYSKRELRKKLNIPQESFVFLSTNLLDSIKDPITLLNAFLQAERDIPCAYLVMLGNGNFENKCREYECDNICFTGRVNNVKEYLYAADVVVSASKSEGLPYAVLEAACSNSRLILSDISQHKEIFDPNEDGVQYFCVGDVSGLKDEMLRAYSWRNKQISHNIEAFSARKMSKSYQKIYCDIIRD